MRSYDSNGNRIDSTEGDQMVARARAARARKKRPDVTITPDAMTFSPGGFEKLMQQGPGALDVSRRTKRDQAEDFLDAHADGMHADLPREGCPECER